jgi:hypothetical protein
MQVQCVRAWSISHVALEFDVKRPYPEDDGRPTCRGERPHLMTAGRKDRQNGSPHRLPVQLRPPRGKYRQESTAHGRHAAARCAGRWSRSCPLVHDLVPPCQLPAVRVVTVNPPRRRTRTPRLGSDPRARTDWTSARCACPCREGRRLQRASWLLVKAFAERIRDRRTAAVTGRIVAPATTLRTTSRTGHQRRARPSRGRGRRAGSTVACANVINPGLIDTGWMTPEIRESGTAHTPAGEFGTPQGHCRSRALPALRRRRLDRRTDPLQQRWVRDKLLTVRAECSHDISKRARPDSFPQDRTREERPADDVARGLS